jgi:hypothetical protein
MPWKRAADSPGKHGAVLVSGATRVYTAGTWAPGSAQAVARPSGMEMALIDGGWPNVLTLWERRVTVPR